MLVDLLPPTLETRDKHFYSRTYPLFPWLSSGVFPIRSLSRVPLIRKERRHLMNPTPTASPIKSNKGIVIDKARVEVFSLSFVPKFYIFVYTILHLCISLSELISLLNPI